MITQRLIAEIKDVTPLGNAENRILRWGTTGSPDQYLRAQDFIWLTWSIYCTTAATFTVEAGYDSGFVLTRVLLTQPILAATIRTPYDLPAPYNYTGDYKIQARFIRCRLVNPGAAMANTEVYIKAGN